MLFFLGILQSLGRSQCCNRKIKHKAELLAGLYGLKSPQFQASGRFNSVRHSSGRVVVSGPTT